MEIKITQNWRMAIKWFPVSKCASWKHWILYYMNYGDVTNKHGFEVRFLGFGFGCMSRPY